MDIGDRRIDMNGNEYAELSTYHEEQPPSPNTSGIYIKVGDDSVGDYRTEYVGQIDNYDNADWAELKKWLVNAIEGLTTYHEERRRDQLPLLDVETMTDQQEVEYWAGDPANRPAPIRNPDGEYDSRGSEL